MGIELILKGKFNLYADTVEYWKGFEVGFVFYGRSERLCLLF